VEPINRYEDYMVNRLEEAVSLADEVERATGVDSVRVCADLFHMNIEEDDLAAAIRAAGPRIAHVHVDDTNRLQPGTGHMDFGSVVEALHDVGYDDWLTLECRLRGEPEEALPASTRFLAGFLKG
jgi:sugar phosphate isomerase/epimerase